MKRPVDDFPAQPEKPNERIDPDVIYGPYTRYPRRFDDLVCVLTTTHYVVYCSVGPDPRSLRPISAVFDTGSGPNLIRKSAFFDGWERYLVRNETVPRLGDANGVANIKTNERFAITISNFLKTPKCLPKGTVVAHAKRYSLAIHALPDNASRTLESVPHLPFERTEEADETDGTQPTQHEPSKSAPPDWRITVNLDHIGDADL